MAKKKKKKQKSLSILDNLVDFKMIDLVKKAPSKKSLNIIIGFDCVSKLVKILRLFGLKYEEIEYQTYGFNSQFLSSEFYEEIIGIFEQYLNTLPTIKSLATYVVFPDEIITIDDYALPIMKAKKIKESLDIEIKKEYKNFKELMINHYVAGRNKQYIVYNTISLKKAYLTTLYKSLATSKLYPKMATYSANAMVDFIFAFKASYRKKSFILLDIKEEYTQVVIVLKGKTAGFSSFKLGYKHLQEDKVLQENMQYDHDVADLAIINAKEKAKMKQLTVDSDDEDVDLNEVADDVEKQLIENVNKNEEPVTNTLDEMASEMVPQEEEVVEESEDINNELEHELQIARKKKIFTRKMPKRYPKFMLREEPTTKEGYVYENFRMFIKKALLYNMELTKKEYIEEIDFILFNMDESYKYLIEMANSDPENENGFKFEFLEGLPNNTKGYLAMLGALYCGMYNPRNNF